MWVPACMCVCVSCKFIKSTGRKIVTVNTALTAHSSWPAGGSTPVWKESQLGLQTTENPSDPEAKQQEASEGNEVGRQTESEITASTCSPWLTGFVSHFCDCARHYVMRICGETDTPQVPGATTALGAGWHPMPLPSISLSIPTYISGLLFICVCVGITCI